MNLNYHTGKLLDLSYSNLHKGNIDRHLRAIERKVLEGEIIIDKGNEKIFRKIIFRMRKYDQGFWEKENWEYKILYYSLIGLISK